MDLLSRLLPSRLSCRGSWSRKEGDITCWALPGRHQSILSTHHLMDMKHLDLILVFDLRVDTLKIFLLPESQMKM
jgi:hypothetical protein